MDVHLTKMLNKAKMNFIQAAAYVKERIYSLTGTPTATIEPISGIYPIPS